MIGRTPGNITAISPLKDGVIADFDICEKMLRHFINEVTQTRWPKPRMVICVPSGITGVEQRAVQEAAEYAGARRAYIIEEPMAAAIGAGLPVQTAQGSMIVDIGGGTTEVAIISLGGIVTSRSARVGGNMIDASITAHVKKEHGLIVGERTAEEIKLALGSAWPLQQEIYAEVRGRDMVSGLPESVSVDSVEIREAITGPVSAIIDSVKATLDDTAPELAADVMDYGITLAGRRSDAARSAGSTALGNRRCSSRRGGPAVRRRAWLRTDARRIRRPPRSAVLVHRGALTPPAVARRAGIRRRTWLRLALLVVTAIALLTLDARGSGGVLDTARGAALDLLGPVRTFGDWAVGPFRNAWRGVVSFDDLEAENAQLRGEMAQAQASVLRVGELERDRQELLALVGARDTARAIPRVTARVIDAPVSNFERTIELAKGRRDGIREGMPVESGDGLIGRVVQASATRSRVELLTDPNFDAGVRIVRSGDDGLASGRGPGRDRR